MGFAACAVSEWLGGCDECSSAYDASRQYQGVLDEFVGQVPRGKVVRVEWGTGSDTGQVWSDKQWREDNPRVDLRDFSGCDTEGLFGQVGMTGTVVTKGMSNEDRLRWEDNVRGRISREHPTWVVVPSSEISSEGSDA